MSEETESHGDHPEFKIPEDEAEVIEMMEADKGEKLTEQEKNLCIAQAKLIGEL